MRRLLLAVVLVVVAGCGPNIKPPPVPPLPNPFQVIAKEIFWSSMPDPSGVHAPRDPVSCTIGVGLPGANGKAFYEPLDPKAVINGWDFWRWCVEPARALGWALPTVKLGADSGEGSPLLDFVLDTAPVLGLGSGHYPDPQATNPSVWARAKIQGV